MKLIKRLLSNSMTPPPSHPLEGVASKVTPLLHFIGGEFHGIIPLIVGGFGQSGK